MSPLQRGASRGRFLLPLPRLEPLPPPPALGLATQLSRDRPADTTPPPLPPPLPDTAAATNTGRTGPPMPPEPAAWAAPPDTSAAAEAATDGGDGEEDKDEEAEVTEEAAEEPGLVPAEPDPAWRLPDIVTPSPPAGRSEERDRDPPPPPLPSGSVHPEDARHARRWGRGTIKLIFVRRPHNSVRREGAEETNQAEWKPLPLSRPPPLRCLPQPTGARRGPAVRVRERRKGRERRGIRL